MSAPDPNDATPGTDEFMKEWEQKRPPEDALKYFGEFPGTVA